MGNELEAFIAELYRAITPKLGGGGINNEQREKMREIGQGYLTHEEHRIIGCEPTKKE